MGVAGFHIQLDIRIFPPEPSKKRGQQIAADGGTGANPHCSFFQPLPFLHRTNSEIVLRKQIARMQQQHLTGFRQSKRAACLFIERNAQFRFESAKLLVNCRGAEIEPFGGSRDAARLGKLYQTAQLAKLHGSEVNRK